MSEFTIKDKTAIAGLGETTYYKRGEAPSANSASRSKRSNAPPTTPASR